MMLTLQDNSNILLRGAHLLTPDALRAAAGEMVQAQEASRLMSGFALTIFLPEAFVRTLENPKAQQAVRLAIYLSPRGLPTICVVCQVGTSQIRYIAAANSPGILEWLKWLSVNSQVQMLIEIEESAKHKGRRPPALWLSCNIALAHPQDMLDAAMKETGLDTSEIQTEIVHVASELCLPDVDAFMLPGLPIEALAVALLPNGLVAKNRAPAEVMH